MEIKKVPINNYNCDDIIIHNINNYYVREYVDKFINFMINNYSDEILANFFLNISYVLIRKRNFYLYTLKGLDISGAYDACTNEILLNDIKVIYHELFHMASTIYQKEDKMIYQGFLQVDLSKKKNNLIGISLNEGYTEYLCSKYFNNEESQAYLYETFVVKIIENIVGINKMENLYLKADLYGLVEELCKYSSKEEVLKFINNFDKLFNKEFKKSKFYQNLQMEIYYFLYNIKLIKIRKDLELGKITTNMAISSINSFINSYNESLYQIKDGQDFMKTYNDVSRTYKKIK